MRRSRPEDGAFGLGFALTTVTCRRRATEPRAATSFAGPVDVLDPGFNLVTARTDDAAVVRVIGELDLATAPPLREVLTDLVALGGLHVTLDVSELAFIDSSGLSVLVTGLKRLREGGGDLALRSPNPAAMKAFEITGLTSFFAIGFESVPESTHGESHGVRRALLGHG